ncbi:hypothetical protein ACFQ7B_07555 [Streptomyces erythrochromogenes]|uniref:hypothetical protein n=1 Tax=Streptomyces erythrochromogenes TaxID=285574 RepID=UPI0036788310
MARIRILQGIAGLDFSWAPGDVVELGADAAAVWADGYRAEYVGPSAPAEDDDQGDEQAEDQGAAVAEKAAARSRGGGRGRRTTTR